MTRTNAHALLTVALRVVAVYLTLMMAPVMLAIAFWGSPNLQMLMMQGFIVTIGIFVWLFADKIAGIGFSSSKAPVFESDLDAALWLRIGVTLIGVATLVQAATTLSYVGALKWHATMGTEYATGQALDPAARAQAVSAVIQLLIGLWLTLGAKGFMGLIERARFAGYRDKPAVERDPPDDETRDA
jgi:hypothetical protein